jgi:hypothetical protein
MANSSKPVPMVVKLLAVLMAIVISGTGVLAVLSHHAPERSTRYGMMSALEGAQADSFGVTVIFIGLLPLLLLMGTARRAAWFGGVVALFIVGSLFINAR